MHLRGRLAWIPVFNAAGLRSRSGLDRYGWCPFLCVATNLTIRRASRRDFVLSCLATNLTIGRASWQDLLTLPSVS